MMLYLVEHEKGFITLRPVYLVDITCEETVSEPTRVTSPLMAASLSEGEDPLKQTLYKT